MDELTKVGAKNIDRIHVKNHKSKNLEGIQNTLRGLMIFEEE